MKSALVLLADGNEEIEAVTTIDLLTRAEIKVTCASISTRKQVRCSRGVVIVAEKNLAEIKNIRFDVVILPGGIKGAEKFRDSEAVINQLKRTQKENGIVAAICASPAVVLIHHRLFIDAEMTGYPATREAFLHWRNDRVCYDVKAGLITSQGPATSFDFALKIIAVLLGRKKAAEVASQLVLPTGIDDYYD